MHLAGVGCKRDVLMGISYGYMHKNGKQQMDEFFKRLIRLASATKPGCNRK